MCQRQNSYPVLSGPNPHLQIAISLVGWCFQMMGNLLRLATSLSLSPWMHFISYEMSSLVRSNAVWNTMTVNKILCEPTDGDVGRSIVGREDTPISRIPTYFRDGNKCFQNESGLMKCTYHQMSGCSPQRWCYIGNSVWAGRLSIQQCLWPNWAWWMEVHDAGHMQNSYPCYYAALFMSTWTLTKRIILSTRLLSSCCAETTPWGVLT